MITLIAVYWYTLTHLAAADTVFADGTFYTWPTVFYQFYTLHAMVDGTMYLLIYTASYQGEKDQQIYTRLLTILQELCQ